MVAPVTTLSRLNGTASETLRQGDPLSETRPLILAASFLESEKMAKMEWITDMTSTLQPTELEPTTLRYWRGNYFEFSGCNYNKLQLDDLLSRLCKYLNAQVYFGPKSRIKPLRVNEGMKRDVLGQLRDLCNVPNLSDMPAWVGNDEPSRPDPKRVLAFKNGIIDLDAWLKDELADDRQLYDADWWRDPSHEWFSETVFDRDYNQLAPAPTRWLNFLAQLWPADQQSINTLQEWFGYVLVADTRQQKVFMLVGPKRSGKGTIARTLTRLIGSANVCGPTLSGMASNFGMSSFIGKLLAIVGDARLSGKADQAIVVERILSLSGEDPIDIDRKNRDILTVRLAARLMLLSNQYPRLADSSGALSSRFIILKLKESFFGKEDTHLESDLESEMSGIFRWAMEGWRRLAIRGRFDVPDSSLDAVAEMEDLGSPVKAFIRDCCVIEAGKEIKVDDLYQVWCWWCQDEGRAAGSKGVFGRDLHAAEPAIHCANRRQIVGRKRVYSGVRLAAATELEFGIWKSNREKKKSEVQS